MADGFSPSLVHSRREGERRSVAEREELGEEMRLNPGKATLKLFLLVGSDAFDKLIIVDGLELVGKEGLLLS